MLTLHARLNGKGYSANWRHETPDSGVASPAWVTNLSTTEGQTGDMDRNGLEIGNHSEFPVWDDSMRSSGDHLPSEVSKTSKTIKANIIIL